MTGSTTQTCEFSPGLYWNTGPARVPSHHQAVLGYCRELGVPLEVEVNTSRGSLLLNPEANGGKPIEMRQAANDTRGKIAELLAKAIDSGSSGPRFPTVLASLRPILPTMTRLTFASANPTGPSILQVSISASSAPGRKALSCRPNEPLR